MAKDSNLHQNFTTSFSESKEEKAKTDKKSIALSQVEDTKCDDIEFILYNKKGLSVLLDTTVGSYHRLANTFFDADEAVTFSDSQSVGVGTPGVIRVDSMQIVGDVLALKEEGGLIPRSGGHLVFDMETEEVKYTGGVNIFAVVRIKYRSKGTKYKFNWPNNADIQDALIVAIAQDGSKASLQITRQDCGEDEEAKKNYGDSTSENNQLQYNLVIESPWSASNSYSPGAQRVGMLIYVYPVYSTGSLEFKASFGKSGDPVQCTFSQLSTDLEMRKLSEAINFSASSIANVSCFVGSFSEFSIAAESSFYDTKGNKIMSPNFAEPGESVTVEEYKDVTRTIKDPLSGQEKQVTQRIQVRYSKQLGPTEVAVTTPMGLLLPASGVARVNYKVPVKMGVLKMDLSITPEDFKNWNCTIYGSYSYSDYSVSPTPIVFMGQATCANPLRSSPAQDSRELKIKEMLST